GPPTSGPSSQWRPSHRRSSSTARYDSSVTRLRSVSSTRSTMTPPLWRAESQLNSAVRALPTWMEPLGAGAKRTRVVTSADYLGATPREDLPGLFVSFTALYTVKESQNIHSSGNQ